MPKKEKIGKVVSNKMQKTIVVSVVERNAHAKYGKIQNKIVKFKAHDENNDCKEGDLVKIQESSPYSRDKTWRLIAILEKVQEV